VIVMAVRVPVLLRFLAFSVPVAPLNAVGGPCLGVDAIDGRRARPDKPPEDTQRNWAAQRHRHPQHRVAQVGVDLAEYTAASQNCHGRTLSGAIGPEAS
jgi:hypothetical protein